MEKLLIRGIVIIGFMFTACGTASASTYIGGGLGTATWDLKVTPLPSAPAPYELEDGVAIRMFAGMRQDYIGGEVELSFSSHDWDTTVENGTHNVAHIVFSGVGYLPILSVFELYGKIGFNMWGTTVDWRGGIYDGENGIDLAYGFGLNINITESIMIRLEHQSLPGMSDGIDSGDIEQNTVNFALGF